MFKKALLTIAFMGIITGTASASQIYAPAPNAVYVRDSSQGPQPSWGTTPVLFIYFSNPVTICGSVYNSTTPFPINIGSAQFDNWTRLATSAQLSGKGVFIETYTPVPQALVI